MQVRARRASGLETEAPYCTLFQLPSGKGQPRAAPHPDLAGRGQRPSSLRRPGPRGGVTAPDPGARPPPGQISSWRGAPPTRTWDPAAISGRCLRPQSVPGLRTAPPGRSPWVGLVLWDPLSRARSRASRPKTPRRGPCRVTEAPRRGVPSPPQRPRDGRRGRTSSREGPPGRHSAPRAYPLLATKVLTSGSPARVLLPRAAPRLSAGGRRISAATPAKLRAPPAPPPRGLCPARALAIPTSLRPGRRPAAPARRSPSRARRSSSLPSPCSSPARLAPLSAPRPRPAGSAPSRPGRAGSSKLPRPPQPFPGLPAPHL